MAPSFAGPGKKLRPHDRECPMVVRIAAARMIARWARSPSSPAPAAHRYAALGLDRSARPSKQERPCRQCSDAHVSHSELCTIETGENVNSATGGAMSPQDDG